MHVLEPNREARLLYIVLSSQKELVDNVVIQERLGSSDHNKLHFNINVKSEEKKVEQCRRDFRKGNYKEIRKHVTLIDWNNTMKNKTTTACWNILRGELYSAIDSYVPMKKQGKWSKKKHLSKEAFRKIRYKQNRWRVYKHTGKDTDYDAYKEALNAATKCVKEKDLGVTMNANMKVSEQGRIAASKGNQVLGMIRRNITYTEKRLIVPPYKAIVRPHLEYCIQAYIISSNY